MKGFYFYQRCFFYIGQAKNELLKPLGFWNETILILTFLAVSGTRPSIFQIATGYIFILLAAATIGKILVASGIIKYNQKIANEQNPELMLILAKVEELEKIIKNNGSRNGG